MQDSNAIKNNRRARHIICVCVYLQRLANFYLPLAYIIGTLLMRDGRRVVFAFNWPGN